MWNFFERNNFTKIGYYPVCKKQNSTSPLDSKFGGSIFYLPEKEVPQCSECHQVKEVLLSLNLSNAPAPVKAFFPENYQNALVEFLYCTECMSSNEEDTIEVLIFTPDQFDKLIVKEPIANAKIEPTLIERWEEFVDFDATSEEYYEKLRESGLDDLEMEEFVKDVRNRYAAKSHLLGYPYFQEGQYDVGEGYVYLANIEDDKNFSMMLGDAGVGQIWMTTGNDFGKFNFTYM
ncbi:WGR domain-containing protein [Histomonas meleagridis]|uniref:WGR domain-containing protein n=1 Tax=Histomonas meleagridis TaxID=135588 RepID=UPI00355A1A98|nr:WGR domain-containing protein [Histomonas meleagridis]KAH0800984.1 WGR domain-containing protein [Histomonas meleagridis]